MKQRYVRVTYTTPRFTLVCYVRISKTNIIHCSLTTYASKSFVSGFYSKFNLHLGTICQVYAQIFYHKGHKEPHHEDIKVTKNLKGRMRASPQKAGADYVPCHDAPKLSS
jgi:hypothetical protein